MPAPHPRMHGLTHVCGGPDPIPGICDLTPPQTDYPTSVLAHPCLAHYWPGDEPSGNLIDRKGSWDLVPATADVSGDTYPQYGGAGPLAGLPDLTAVVNAGVAGIPADDEGRFGYSYGTAPPEWTGTAEFTIEVWAYATLYGTSGALYLISGGGVELYVLGSPGQLWATRGSSNAQDPDDFPLDAWQHIVARYDGANLDLFRNGSLIDTVATTTPVTATGPLTWLNINTGSSWAPWNGRSAQLALYDCALTDTEIADHFGLRDTGSSGAGLVLTSDGAGGTNWLPAMLEWEDA